MDTTGYKLEDKDFTYIATDTTIKLDGRLTHGTLATCSNGWHTFYQTMDGSAEAELHQHKQRNDRRRYTSVSPYLWDIISNLNHQLREFDNIAFFDIPKIRTYADHATLEELGLIPPETWEKPDFTPSNELNFYIEEQPNWVHEQGCSCFQSAPCPTCEGDPDWQNEQYQAHLNGINVENTKIYSNNEHDIVIGAATPKIAEKAAWVYYAQQLETLNVEVATVTPTTLKPNWEQLPRTENPIDPTGNGTPAYIVESE